MILNLFTFLLVLLVGIFSLVPYVHGLQLTPPGSVYLGTVHFPPDYLFYLSQIAQGDRHFFLTEYIWGPERFPSSLVGSVYVFWGHLLFLIKIQPIVAYQIFLGFAALLYAMGTYFVLREIFPKSRGRRFVSLLFFMIAGPIPQITSTAGKILFSYERAWHNFGDPYNRFDAAPHHLLITASLMMIIVLLLLFWRTKKSFRYFIIIPLCFLAALLTTIEPIKLFETLLSAGLLIVAKTGPLIKKNFRSYLLSIIEMCIPLLMMTIIIVPFFLYMNRVVNAPPYNMGKAQEAALQVHLTIQELILQFGIICILGFFSLPNFLKKKQLSRFYLGICTLVAFGLYLSPIPEKLGILNMRFSSLIPILFFAASTTDALFWLGSFAKKYAYLATSLLVLFVFILIIPSFILEFPNRISVNTGNPSFYLNSDVYNAMMIAKTVSRPDETIIAFWPFEQILPGITGRKGYLYQTMVDPQKKTDLSYRFIDNRMPQEEMISFLKTNGIGTIITYVDAFRVPTPFLKEIYRNRTMTVYRFEE